MRLPARSSRHVKTGLTWTPWPIEQTTSSRSPCPSPCGWPGDRHLRAVPDMGAATGIGPRARLFRLFTLDDRRFSRRSAYRLESFELRNSALLRPRGSALARGTPRLVDSAGRSRADPGAGTGRCGVPQPIVAAPKTRLATSSPGKVALCITVASIPSSSKSTRFGSTLASASWPPRRLWRRAHRVTQSAGDTPRWSHARGRGRLGERSCTRPNPAASRF